MELTRCQNAYFRYPNNVRLAYTDFIKTHTSTCVYCFNLLHSIMKHYLNYIL